jgi:polar amino acid transport system ATP-binding protein
MREPGRAVGPVGSQGSAHAAALAARWGDDELQPLSAEARYSESPGDPLLRLESVCVAFKGQEVVHDVDLAVEQGEVIALIGPSGAGKSSLLRAINHLERPTSGRLTFAGNPCPERPNKRELVALRREIGMVFQSFNLFPHLSARDNVALALIHAAGRSRDTARERAARELAHVGLADLADRRPAQLSGGQQQRVAIARALALDPRIMLFDEPTSALDPELGMEVLTTMRRLAGEGMTMVVVTHEMHFAQDVADRVVFMADGRIVEQGLPAQMMREPRHPRTQKFLAAIRGR